MSFNGYIISVPMLKAVAAEYISRGYDLSHGRKTISAVAADLFKVPAGYDGFKYPKAFEFDADGSEAGLKVFYTLYREAAGIAPAAAQTAKTAKVATKRTKATPAQLANLKKARAAKAAKAAGKAPKGLDVKAVARATVGKSGGVKLTQAQKDTLISKLIEIIS